MRFKYNLVLRALASEQPSMLTLHEGTCGRNFYATTLHLINAALAKLARLSVRPLVSASRPAECFAMCLLSFLPPAPCPLPPAPCLLPLTQRPPSRSIPPSPQTPGVLYRGLSGGVAPQAFWRADHRNVRGAVEGGILSCVRSPTVALQHGVRGCGGLQATVLVVREGVGDTAADLSWLSEYPEEGEHAFPPLTSLVVHHSTVEGGCLLLEVQPSVPHMGGQLLEAEKRLLDNKENASRGLVCCRPLLDWLLLLPLLCRSLLALLLAARCTRMCFDTSRAPPLAHPRSPSRNRDPRSPSLLTLARRSHISAPMCCSPRRPAPPRPKPRRSG